MEEKMIEKSILKDMGEELESEKIKKRDEKEKKEKTVCKFYGLLF